YTSEFCETFYCYANLFGSFSLLSFRRNELTKNMLLDEDLKSCQDWDFIIRLRTLGKVGVIEEPLCETYAHSGIRISNNEMNKLIGLTRFYEKHQLNLPIGAQRWIRSYCDFLKSGCSRSYVKKLFYLARGMAIGLASDIPIKIRLVSLMRRVIEVSFGYESAETLKSFLRGSITKR